MNEAPETRPSLLVRIAEPDNHEAWEQFLQLYQPLVYRLALHSGLQEADALEVVQEVLLSVSKAIETWTPSGQTGSFRAWLYRIARNQLLDHLSRQQRSLSRGSGETWVQQMLALQPDRTDDSGTYVLEFRRQRFVLAARDVRAEFSTATWTAFWSTAVKGESVNSVAKRLSKRPGSIYTARCRVMQRIKRRVEELGFHETD